MGNMTDATRALARHSVLLEMTRQRLTNIKLASDARVDPKTVNDFLAGNRWPQRVKRAAISAALGWPEDEIDRIEQTGYASKWDEDDASKPSLFEDASEQDPEAAGIASFAYLMQLVPTARRADALRAVFRVLADHLDADEADQVRIGLSAVPDTVGDLVAADEQEQSISGEQESPDTP